MSTHRLFARQIANALTLVRIAAAPFFVYSLFGRSVGSSVAAMSLFLFAAASDYFDGYAARRLGEQSRFGEFLDPLADKILTGSAFLSFAFIPELTVPLWLVIVILFREALLTLFRMIGIGKGKPLRTEYAGKVKTAFQMASIFLILTLLLVQKVHAAPGMGENRPMGVALGAAAGVLVHARLPFVLVAASAALAVLSLASYLVRNWSALFSAPADRAGKGVLDWTVLFLSTGCFVGFIPRAGGTIATILGSVIWVFCSRGPIYYALCALTVIVGFFAAGYAEKYIFGEKDSRRIVIDEVAGILITFLTFSFSFSPYGLLTCALGVALFRFFDILKPAPIHLLERCGGGAGVLLDDLAAGALANAGLQLFRCLTHLGWDAHL